MLAIETMTDLDAKINFGKAITKAQQAPLKITNGNGFVIMMSANDFEKIEQIKYENLQYKLDIAAKQITDENLLDHKDVFAEYI